MVVVELNGLLQCRGGVYQDGFLTVRPYPWNPCKDAEKFCHYTSVLQLNSNVTTVSQLFSFSPQVATSQFLGFLNVIQTLGFHYDEIVWGIMLDQKL